MHSLYEAIMRSRVKYLVLSVCIIILYTVGMEILDSLIFCILNLCLDLIFLYSTVHVQTL